MSIFDADETWGADATEGLVAVAAGELYEWAWLVSQLADWLATTAEGTPIRIAETDRIWASGRRSALPGLSASPQVRGRARPW